MVDVPTDPVANDTPAGKSYFYAWAAVVEALNASFPGWASDPNKTPMQAAADVIKRAGQKASVDQSVGGPLPPGYLMEINSDRFHFEIIPANPRRGRPNIADGDVVNIKMVVDGPLPSSREAGRLTYLFNECVFRVWPGPAVELPRR